MDITYPLYLVPLESGFVSVVDNHNGQSDPTYYLAVFSDESLASNFMADCAIDSVARPLRNAREFAWLLQSLRDPVLHVAFDPQSTPHQVVAASKVTVRELLEQYVVIDYSPWDYPVFLIRQQGGYSSIEGQASDGTATQAINFFSSQDKAEQYLVETEEPGTIDSLADRHATRAFLRHLAPEINAVALDPKLSETGRTAEYCFAMQTILDKYLAERPSRED